MTMYAWLSLRMKHLFAREPLAPATAGIARRHQSARRDLSAVGRCQPLPSALRTPHRFAAVSPRF